MDELAGKCALVTGGGRGIGKACAIELARRGADLVINDRPGSANLDSTADEIRQIGRTCYTIEADVFSRSGCEQLVERTIGLVQRIDILISNPAYSRRGKFLDYPAAEFERTIAGTLTSGFHISQLVARQMVQHQIRGKIVFISSVLAEMPIGTCMPYAAAKAGLNQMMKTIAVELSPHQINANAIEPGWIDTPGERETFDDQALVHEVAQLPWRRMGLAEEIGKAAAFLSSPAADYITAAVLPVDGLYRYKDCVIDQTSMLKT